jgi:hypothetical protein
MSEFTEVKDSGKREEFTTGSRRDTRTGKGRYDLISPIFEARLARHLENGAVKYGDRNWEKGQPLSRYADSAKRHINKFLEGHRDEDHLAAAAWNIHAMIHTEEMVKRGNLPAELNDLVSFLPMQSAPAPSPVTEPAVADPDARTAWLVTTGVSEYPWLLVAPHKSAWYSLPSKVLIDHAWPCMVRTGGTFSNRAQAEAELEQYNEARRAAAEYGLMIRVVGVGRISADRPCELLPL